MPLSNQDSKNWSLQTSHSPAVKGGIMVQQYQFNRMEFAGSLGDLGTLLPLVIGLVMVNGLSVTGIFFTIGLFYILAGIYFGVPVPVQPMKAISAYALATGATAMEVTGSAALVSLILLFIGITGTIDVIGRVIPKVVIRGVQLSTGILLMTQGIKLIAGKAALQLSYSLGEPFLQTAGRGASPCDRTSRRMRHSDDLLSHAKQKVSRRHSPACLRANHWPSSRK